MNKIRILAVALVGVGVLTGCQNTGSKELLGTLGGAGLGGLAGSQIGNGNGKLVAVAVGALGGAFIGKSIGKNLDEVDQMMAVKSQQNALEHGPSNKPMRWKNPDTGNQGAITPKPAYQTETGQFCREFQQDVTVGGKTEEAYGKACRQPDGSWKIVPS